MLSQFIPLPADVAEKARLAAEKARHRRWQYEMKTGRKNHHRPGELKYGQYPFLGLDGEAVKGHGYCLMGSSDGRMIRGMELSTEDFLDFILETKRDNPQSILIIFGGRYDFDEIFRRSMPWNRISQIKNFGATYWHGYKIRQAEGKWCEIAKGGVTARVFEIFGWFHCTYEKALAKYKIAVTAADKKLISAGKKARGTFTWRRIKSVTRYMMAELRYMPDLMDTIRTICHDAGFRPRAWYGPSALATELLTRNRIEEHQSACPREVGIAAQYAYAGGRFEMPRGGIVNQKVYMWDWNSAYMTAALELPCLAHGKWRYGKTFEPGKFAVYHIRYSERDSRGHPKRPDHSRVYPLFRRFGNGNVVFCNQVEGWYWSPEAELVKDDPSAIFLEAWIFDEDSDCKPFAFVRDIYAKRMRLAKLGSAAAQAFKWALAAIYGQLARQAGWNRHRKTAPKYHQLEWAGYITSRCRAEMYRMAKLCGRFLLSIDTDSVTAMCPIPIPPEAVGTELGQWKGAEADGGVFFQNGIYFTHANGDWDEGKRRGIEQTPVPVLSPELLMEAIRKGKPVRLLPKTRYISLRMALNQRTNDAGRWEEHPSDKLVFGGHGKRIHNTFSCKHTCTEDIHQFLINTPVSHLYRQLRIGQDTGIFDNIKSLKYPLPWKDEKDLFDKNLADDIMWVNPDTADVEDQWIQQLAIA